MFKELTATDAVVMPVLQTASYIPGIDIAASAIGYGIASYSGDVLYQEEFGVGLAMSVFFVDGKALGELTERVVKGIVVNTAKKKYIHLAKQNVDDFAEFLADEMRMQESRARKYAEKLHSKPRDQYDEYINQTVYERLGGARDELEFDWRLALIFDDDGIFGKFIEKFGLEKADELWRFCNGKSYREAELKEVFKYFDDISSPNVPEILTLFIGAKGRTAQLLEAAFKGGADAATGKVLLEDLGKGSREFVEFIERKGDDGVGAWEVVSDGPVEIRRNLEALEIFDDHVKYLGSDFIALKARFNSASDKIQWLDDAGREVRSKARSIPGTATGFGKDISSPWLRGTEGNAGRVPKLIADKLRNKDFIDFAAFRSEFWKTVANEPILANQFSASNITLMKKGNAPIPVEDQWLGGQMTYILHHEIPIYAGGKVYDIDNLIVVTPRYHNEILSPSYHFGK